MAIQHQQIGGNRPKAYKSTILSPHAMYFCPKKAKTRFFPELSLGYFMNRLKILSLCPTCF